MLPAIEPGDWLLINPLSGRWPPVGSVVVFRNPDRGELDIKRVEALAGTRVPYAGGFLEVFPGEAWVTADASPGLSQAAGFGPPRDSYVYGPVPVDLLLGRVVLRYAPIRRIGRISSRGGPLLADDGPAPRP